MAEAPTTRLSLLLRIRDAKDSQAWTQFVDLYAPLVYGFARKHGLQDADAADLTQDVLRAVAGAIAKLNYDPRRGSSRGWFFTVVRNKLRNFLSARKRQDQGSGDTGVQNRLEAQPSPEEDEGDLWTQEYEQRVLAWAAEQVRSSFQDSTWQAFWRTAVEGQSAQEVAKALALSVGAVYIAKSRVLARLREQIQRLENE